MAQVYGDGRVTLHRQLRKRFHIEDGDYARLVLVEVLKKSGAGKWVKRKVD